MMRPANLVPDDCLHRRARRKRISGWVSAGTVAAIVLLTLSARASWTASALDDLREEIAQTQRERSDVERRYASALKRCTELLRRARALTAPSASQQITAALVELAERAPDGIVLTNLTVEPAAPRRALQTVVRSVTAEAQQEEPADQEANRTVHMHGFALGHDELRDLTKALEDSRVWVRVTIERAANEPYRAGRALAFHLQCRWQEQQP